jgi:parallel beta-helix repeat protein
MSKAQRRTKMIAPAILRPYAMAVAVSFFLLAGATGAHADNQITGCEQYCAASCDPNGPAACRSPDSGENFCELFNDVECSQASNEFIDLKDGTDLDMNSKDLSCPGQGTICSRAILMRAANSEVYNSETAESVIGGLTDELFTIAVQCDGKSGSTVEGIRSLKNTNGILDCQTVTNNVVHEGGDGFLQTGIRVTVNGASTIEDNYVDGHNIGIWVWNVGTPTVDHNIIDAIEGVNWGIVNSSNSSATVEDNVIMGAGDNANSKVVASTGGSVSDNICSKDHADCGKCKQDGFCDDLKPPFTFP